MTDTNETPTDMTALYDGHTYVVGKCVALSNEPMKVDLLSGDVKITTAGDLTITGKPALKHHTLDAETCVVGT